MSNDARAASPAQYPFVAGRHTTGIRADAAPQPAPADVRFQSLLESAPDAIVIVERTGQIVLVNSQAERMFGYDRGELIGQPIEALLPERLRARHERHRATYVGEPHTRPMGAGLDLVARHRDGREFPVE